MTDRVGREPTPEVERLRTIEKAVRDLLAAIGEDVDRDGLSKTPQRVAETCLQIFGGVGRDPVEPLRATFPAENNDLVLVKDIPVTSFCEHHLLPFNGVAHVGYLPDGKVTGLSKIPQMIDILARRPQLQENLTALAASAVDEALSPLGVIVILECQHLCVSIRGEQVAGTTTVTVASKGVYADPMFRADVIKLIR